MAGSLATAQRESADPAKRAVSTLVALVVTPAAAQGHARYCGVHGPRRRPPQLTAGKSVPDVVAQSQGECSADEPGEPQQCDCVGSGAAAAQHEPLDPRAPRDSDTHGGDHRSRRVAGVSQRRERDYARRSAPGTGCQPRDRAPHNPLDVLPRKQLYDRDSAMTPPNDTALSTMLSKTAQGGEARNLALRSVGPPTGGECRSSRGRRYAEREPVGHNRGCRQRV